MTIEQMIARQQELLNAARSAGRNMTREEAAEFDSLQRSIDAARAAGAGIAHGGQSSTPAAPANNTPEGQRQQTPAAGNRGHHRLRYRHAGSSSRRSVLPETTLEYDLIIAAGALKMPIEFFKQLKPKDAMALKNRVTSFLFGEE